MKSTGFAVRQAGFTLIEVLVVLVIVAIIGVGSYSLLETFFNTDRVLNGRAEQMRRLSMAMYRLDSDLRQLTLRPVKNAYSGYEPAFQGESSEFEFTRLGAANLTGEPRGELQRVHYGVGFADQAYAEAGERSDGASSGRGGARAPDSTAALLLRSRWQVLDRGPDTEPVAEPLLDDVVELIVRYYDRDSEVWLAQWPPASGTRAPGAVDLRLPRAIEVTLITGASGELRRTFVLPQNSGPVRGASGADGTGGRGDSSGDDNGAGERGGDNADASEDQADDDARGQSERGAS